MILDTCGLLWLAGGGKELSKRTLKAIAEASAVHVVTISGFELALKVARGKLRLPLPTAEWVHEVVEHHGLSVLEMDMGIMIRAAELPAFHDDPCDRMIIAAALVKGWPVVTKDHRFEQYGVEVLG